MNCLVRPLACALLAIATNMAFATPSTAEPSPRVEVIRSNTDVDAAQAVLGLRDFDTAYLMSTGRRLSVRAHGESLQVRYGRRAPAWLNHDGEGRFVSGDGQLALRFALDADGDPELVRLSLPADWQ